MSEWVPTWQFLRRGHASSGPFDSNAPVTWSFERQSRKGLGCAFVVCSMAHGNLRAVGQGYAMVARNAMVQAFAEAWERLWVVHMSGRAAISSSNGFAAGKSDAAARDGARGELIERAILQEAWANQRGWCRVPIRSVKAALSEALLERQEWRVRTFELQESKLGDVLVGLAQHYDYGAVLDAAFLGPDADRSATEAKLLRSISRAVAFRSTICQFELPIDAEPSDHSRFYSQPASRAAFSFLDAETGPGQLSLRDPDAISVKLLYPAGSFPAVAMATHVAWPALTWGKSSIRGVNKWPHPLA